MKSPKKPGAVQPGNRLRNFAQLWRQLRASPKIVDMVMHGHRITFVNRGPKLTWPYKRLATQLPDDQMKVIKEEVAKLVEKGAMRVVPNDEARSSKAFYSRLFCVQKADGISWRPVINLKPLNKFVFKRSFRMETIKSVRNALRPGMWGASIDLKDAYYHVGIHRRSRKYLRFIIEGVIYEFIALPMGYTKSPGLFTDITRFITSFCRGKNIFLIMYIDE